MLWLTVHAAVKSTATQAVRCGCLFWLKSVAISLVSCSKAEVVECPGRKPCWSTGGSRWLLTVGSKRASITRSWTDERDGPIRSAERAVLAWFRDWDDFQNDGIRQDVTESLKSAVRYSIPRDPRCFRWKMLSLSGPKARVLLQLLIPLVTWSVVSVTAEVNDFR